MTRGNSRAAYVFSQEIDEAQKSGSSTDLAVLPDSRSYWTGRYWRHCIRLPLNYARAVLCARTYIYTYPLFFFALASRSCSLTALHFRRFVYRANTADILENYALPISTLNACELRARNTLFEAARKMQCTVKWTNDIFRGPVFMLKNHGYTFSQTIRRIM